MEKRWQVAERFPEEFKKSFPEMDDVVLQLLWNRNLKTQKEIDEFFNPDYGADVHSPFLFKDMERAVARIKKAVENQEKVLVYGDYDADGVCASTILYETLKKMGSVPEVFLPHRETDGYGLNLKRVEEFAASGTKLIITCDCGISNAPEVARANELGMEVIITDHHEVPAVLPQAFATIHPQTEDNYPWKGLSGAGVAWKLSQALLKDSGGFEKWFLDLVAISCVSDVMPLLGETRTLTKYGLLVLNKTKRLGLKKLIESASIKPGALDTYSIGFMIAPRINAAGRMNHASAAFKLMIEENAETAVLLAGKLNKENSERQKQAEKIFLEAKFLVVEEKQEENAAILVFKSDWMASLVGLAAGKLAETFYRPAIAMTEREGRIIGSGRSIEGVDLMELMNATAKFLDKFGGHKGACGFTLKEGADLEEFKKEFVAVAAEKVKGLDLAPRLNVDAEISFEQADWKLYENLVKFEPFGEKNPHPRFMVKGAKVMAVEAVGNGDKHLRLFVSHTVGSEAPYSPTMKKMIGFFIGQHIEKLKIGTIIDIIFEVGVNEWNGNRELQYKIIDIKYP
jgi:single-stranded-DNA-specific exonuclease